MCVSAPPAEGSERDSLLGRYTDEQRAIIATFWEKVASTRKCSTVADSVQIAELRRWKTLDADRVLYGLTTYLSGEHYLDKKREEYAWGIMRRASDSEVNRPGNGNGAKYGRKTQKNAAVAKQWLERMHSENV